MNNQEQKSSLPPSASTANKQSLAACCGSSLTNLRHHFPKTPTHSPVPVLPPLPPPHTMRRSVSDLNHSPAKTSSRFSTDLDTADSKRMKDRLRETCKIRRCFSEPYKLPSATNLNRFQPAPVVPARASAADPTFLLSLMALYMALSIHPQTIGKKRPSDWSAVEIWWGILLCIGMESTFYILINWVADKPYPILLWVALIIGKILFWISQFGNLPAIAYVPAVTILNTCLLGSIAIKIHRNIGWGMAYRFVMDNLGILKKLF